MIRTRTPSRVSHRANTKPVGPAPTIRMSLFSVKDTFLSSRRYPIERGPAVVQALRSETYARNPILFGRARSVRAGIGPGDGLQEINPLTGEKKWEVPLTDFPGSAGHRA